MKKLALLILLALLVPFATAVLAEEVEEHEVKLVLMQDDGERIEIEDSELAVGESKQFFTESGKEVVLARTAEGFEVTIDGERIDLGGHHGARHRVEIEMDEDGEHDGERHVIVEKKIIICSEGEDCEEGGEHVFIARSGDGEGLHAHGDGHKMLHRMHVGEGADGDVKILHLKRSGALEHLRESGVLDSLSAADREKVVEALEAFESEREVDVEMVHGGDAKAVWIDESGEVHTLEGHAAGDSKN